MFFYKDGSLYRKSNGKKAARYHKSNGYMVVSFDRKMLLEHRITWAMHKGYWPKILDHINRDRTDNRIENLREATFSQNVRNAGLRKDNKTGYRGVCYNIRQGKYMSQTTLTEGRRKYLGQFTCPKEAALAYNHHTGKAHGAFAVFNQVFEDVDNHSEE